MPSERRIGGYGPSYPTLEDVLLDLVTKPFSVQIHALELMWAKGYITRDEYWEFRCRFVRMNNAV